MRVKTLIATSDTAYTNHISHYISEFHTDTMEISVCNTVEHLRQMQRARRYDVALIDAQLMKEADLNTVTLPMLLWSQQDLPEAPMVPEHIIKHRRISKTVSDVLEKYATVSSDIHLPGERAGEITAVWSPAGGVGKTAVALACAMAAVMKQRDVFYLNLESFSGTPVYFTEPSRSISAVLEMLESGDGNIRMFIQSICGMDNGIKYLYSPENFDDMCILSADNISELVTCCADITDNLIVDLSCACDVKTRKVFELADNILLVTDKTDAAQHKMTQFISQSNVYESNKDKIVMVTNKGATKTAEIAGELVSLPHIDSMDSAFVYKALAMHMAERANTRV